MKKTKRIIAKIIIGNASATIDDNLIDTDFEDLDRANVSDLLSFGIYVNRGSLSFVDREKLAQRIISENAKELNSVKVEFYLFENSTERLIKTLFVNDIDINEETNVVTLELISNIIKWQEYTVPTIYLFDTDPIPLKTIIDKINEHIFASYKITINISEVSYQLFTYCKVYCPYIEQDTLWNIISKVCELCGGRIYEDEYGNPYITSDFKSNFYQGIVIEPKNILTVSNYSPEYKNRINKDFSAVFKTREKRWQAPIDDGFSFTIYENNGNFIEDNPNNLNVKIIELYEDETKTRIDARVECNANSQYKLYSIGKDLFVEAVEQNGWFYSVEGYSEKVAPQYRDVDATIKNTSGEYIIGVTILDVANLGRKKYFTTAKIVAYADYFADGEDEEKRTNNTTDTPYQMPSNDLFQTQNLYNKVAFSDWYLKECASVTKRDCLECECVFSDYYDDEGNLILNSNGNFLQTFNRQHTVTPYVIRKGEKQPFRTDNDFPVSYKIVGIKYSYKGMLRQKLYLQAFNESTTTISFTIQGVDYTIENAQTWRDFATDNSDIFAISTFYNQIFYRVTGYEYVSYPDGTLVDADELIIANTAYIFTMPYGA